MFANGVIGTDRTGADCVTFSKAGLFAFGPLVADDELSGLGRFKALRRSRARCFLSAWRGVREGLVTFEGPAEDEREGGEVIAAYGRFVDWSMLPVVGSEGGTSGGTGGWLLCTEASWIVGGKGFMTNIRIKN